MQRTAAPCSALRGGFASRPPNESQETVTLSFSLLFVRWPPSSSRGGAGRRLGRLGPAGRGARHKAITAKYSAKYFGLRPLLSSFLPWPAWPATARGRNKERKRKRAGSAWRGWPGHPVRSALVGPRGCRGRADRAGLGRTLLRSEERGDCSQATDPSSPVRSSHTGGGASQWEPWAGREGA